MKIFMIVLLAVLAGCTSKNAASGPGARSHAGEGLMVKEAKASSTPAPFAATAQEAAKTGKTICCVLSVAADTFPAGTYFIRPDNSFFASPAVFAEHAQKAAAKRVTLRFKLDKKVEVNGITFPDGLYFVQADGRITTLAGQQIFPPREVRP